MTKKAFDSPVVIQGANGTRWIVRTHANDSITVIGLERDLLPGERTTLWPGDSFQITITLHYGGDEVYQNRS